MLPLSEAALAVLGPRLRAWVKLQVHMFRAEPAAAHELATKYAAHEIEPYDMWMIGVAPTLELGFTAEETRSAIEPLAASLRRGRIP